MSDTKVCLRCRESLQRSAFSRATPKSNYGLKHLGLDVWCKACRRRHAELRQSVDYELELYKQHGGCAICGEPPPPGKRLHIDHCYETGLFRALLCMSCNTRVSVLEDAAFVRRALRYLENICPQG